MEMSAESPVVPLCSSDWPIREKGARNNATATVVARILVTLFAAAFLAPGVAHAQPPTLKFFNSFTVTGNYVVCGVDLLPQSQANGFVTGTIRVGQGECASVPENADIVAAYLYWETIWSVPADLEGALFRGQPVTAVKSGAVPLVGPYSPCWSNGGDNLSMMRADVLRLLPPQLDPTGRPTGKRLVNHATLQQYATQYPNGKWLFDVTLPERGTGNQLPQSGGASLLLVWRDPSQPLRTVVINDGLQLQAPGEVTTFTIPGFLQSSAGDAQVTHIVGSGAPNDTDQIWFNSSAAPIGTNRFVRASGGQSDRAWSNPTISVSSLMPGTDGGVYGEQVTTRVDHGSTSPYDCLSWAAVVFSTTVHDGDGDGVVSKLEDVSGLLNPADRPYPDLHAMGASSNHKDLFVELGRMVAGSTSYGFPIGHPFHSTFPQVTSSGHDHMPSPAALKIARRREWDQRALRSRSRLGGDLQGPVSGSRGSRGESRHRGDGRRWRESGPWRGVDCRVTCLRGDVAAQSRRHAGQLSIRILPRHGRVAYGLSALSAGSRRTRRPGVDRRRRERVREQLWNQHVPPAIRFESQRALPLRDVRAHPRHIEVSIPVSGCFRPADTGAVR
jgi:hypothetical protein